MKGPGFNLFNRLSGTIHVETSEEPERIGSLLNLKSKPTSKLVDVTWPNPDVYERDNDDEPFRPLTEEEKNLVVFETPTLRVNSFATLPGPGAVVKHDAPNGKHFTIRDMIQVVIETERQTRGDTNWFGGIDVHHIFFEGMRPRDDKHWGVPMRPDEDGSVWTISWGS